VELRFYILLGLMLALGMVKNKHIMWLCALWPGIGLYLHFTKLEEAQDWFAGQYAALFAAGMMLYMIYSNGHTLMRWMLLLFDTAIAALFTGIKGRFDAGYLSGLDVPAWHFQMLAVVCVAILAVCTLTPLKHIQARWMAVAGSLTFPLYLFHQLWGWWIIEELHGMLNKYVLLFGLIAFMLGWAYLVARFVEKPFGLPLRNATIKTLSASKELVEKAFTHHPLSIPEPKYQQSWHQSR